MAAGIVTKTVKDGLGGTFSGYFWDDGTGTLKPISFQPLASTGTLTIVTSSSADQVILAANAARLGFKVFNDSTSTLFLLLASGTSSATSHSVQVGPGGFFEDATYAGVVKGIWSTFNGAARVTELA